MAWSKVILLSAVIIIVAAASLLAMGRTPFYKYGPVRIWSGDIWSRQNSQQIADPYTFTHLPHGIGFYFLLRLLARRLSLGTRGVIAIALESTWEVFENTDYVINRYREATLSLDYYGDSIINSVFDIITAGLGFWLAAKLPTKVTIIGFILIEVVLAYLIRDNLTLNILMLIYPIEAIKQWQLGGP